MTYSLETHKNESTKIYNQA